MIPAFALQLVKGLNFFLLFLLSPLWIGLLANATLLLMYADARRGAAPKALAAIPIAVYALNLAASGASYLNYRALDVRLKRENAAQSLPFDPSRLSLVGPGDLIETLVQTHALPVAYADGSDGRVGVPTSWRVLPQAACDTIPLSEDVAVVKGGVRIDDVYAEGGCLLKSPAAPDHPPITVRITQRTALLGVEALRETAIATPDGRRATIVTGRATILSPIPFPLVTCFTWSGLECHAAMLGLPRDVGRASPRRRGDDDYAAERPWIPRVLGLASRTARPAAPVDFHERVRLDDEQTARLAAGSEAVVARARALAGKAADEEYTRLDRRLAGDMSGPTPRPWLLIRYAARMDDAMADRIMDRIAADRAEPARAQQRRDLGELAASLPPERFARLGPRLLKAVRQDAELRAIAPLLTRLGDLGETAAPTLEALLDSVEPDRRAAVMLGLCRAGPAARGAADRAATVALAGSDPEIRQAATVALLRMDRRDLAERLAPPRTGDPAPAVGPGYLAFLGSDERWNRQLLARVSGASPPSVCKARGGHPLADVPWLRD